MKAIHCSIFQALDVYADVAMAWAGVHGFGGHTAEIYAYRLWPYCPSIGRDGITKHLEWLSSVYHEDAVRMCREARSDLATICKHAEKGLGGKVTIDGMSIEEWGAVDYPFCHRAHVCFEESE